MTQPRTKAGRKLVDPEQQPEWLRDGITYALDPDAFSRTILAIEAEAQALVVNDDDHWHRGPSNSCSICRFGGHPQAAPPSEKGPVGP